jgi:uncharacterized protein YceK
MRCITTVKKGSALSRAAAYAMQSPQLSAAGLRPLAKLDVGAPRDRYLGRITPDGVTGKGVRSLPRSKAQRSHSRITFCGPTFRGAGGSPKPKGQPRDHCSALELDVGCELLYTRMKRPWLIALFAATVVVLLSGCGLLRSNSDTSPAANTARLDTQVQFQRDQYVRQFPWSADLMNTLDQEGLLTSPHRVFELYTYFQMACVGGRDMRAGHPEKTAADLAEEFHIDVSTSSAQRLNAAQQQFCAKMPLQQGPHPQ